MARYHVPISAARMQCRAKWARPYAIIRYIVIYYQPPRWDFRFRFSIFIIYFAHFQWAMGQTRARRRRLSCFDDFCILPRARSSSRCADWHRVMMSWRMPHFNLIRFDWALPSPRRCGALRHFACLCHYAAYLPSYACWRLEAIGLLSPFTGRRHALSGNAYMSNKQYLLIAIASLYCTCRLTAQLFPHYFDLSSTWRLRSDAPLSRRGVCFVPFHASHYAMISRADAATVFDCTRAFWHARIKHISLRVSLHHTTTILLLPGMISCIVADYYLISTTFPAFSASASILFL